jgi:enoyl-CoA hydratase/carnithine racemase
VSVRFALPPDHPHVAVVTIDRPEAANALDPPTLRDLAAAWRRIAGDPDIRCAVLRSGQARLLRRHGHERRSAAQRLARQHLDDDVRRLARRRDRHRRLRNGVPLVCAISGHAPVAST